MSTRDLLRDVEYRRFARPRSVRDYGFRDGKPIPQEGSPSGHLLPWVAIDDVADAQIAGRPPQFIVTGEHITEGITHPELAVSDAYMKWAGNERVGHKWRRLA